MWREFASGNECGLQGHEEGAGSDDEASREMPVRLISDRRCCYRLIVGVRGAWCVDQRRPGDPPAGKGGRVRDATDSRDPRAVRRKRSIPPEAGPGRH